MKTTKETKALDQLRSTIDQEQLRSDIAVLKACSSSGEFPPKELINKYCELGPDKLISTLLEIHYPKFWSWRKGYNLKTYKQRYRKIVMHSTGEKRCPGSVRGVVRDDKLDVEYFSKIDTAEKAYWLGLFYADGYVSCRNGRPKEAGIALRYSDSDLLLKFKKSINSNHSVKKRKHLKTLGMGTSYMSEIRITCQRFTQCLIDQGVIPKKSGILLLTDNVDLFFDDFLRGYIDGDGSIGEVNFAIIVNSRVFGIQLQRKVVQHFGHKLRLSKLRSPVTNKYVYRLTGYKKNADVLRRIYLENNNVAMSRKKQKVIEFWGKPFKSELKAIRNQVFVQLYSYLLLTKGCKSEEALVQILELESSSVNKFVTDIFLAKLISKYSIMFHEVYQTKLLYIADSLNEKGSLISKIQLKRILEIVSY